MVDSDCESVQSPASKFTKPITSILFNSPRLFTGLTPESQLMMSPTSILDSIPFSGFKNPFSSELSTTKSDHRRNNWDNLESKKVGLSILDSLQDNNIPDHKHPKLESRMVLFGSQLKIQIPNPQQAYLGDFGIKTRTCQLVAPKLEKVESPGVFSGCLAPAEMELSEDYTCVISHGPNPKTTHIFDNCVVKRCCGAAARSSDDSRHDNKYSYSLPDDFLSFCYTCKKDLRVGKDIYMYKGEMAFCSDECRYEEMVLDRDVE